MAPDNSNGRRIVREWSDDTCGTGESYKELADGSVWRSHRRTTADPVTGVEYGIRRGNRIDPVEP